jgi:hypothetical protein
MIRRLMNWLWPRSRVSNAITRNARELSKLAGRLESRPQLTESTCPECGAPVYADRVAVWCSRSKYEGGDCGYHLMSG